MSGQPHFKPGDLVIVVDYEGNRMLPDPVAVAVGPIPPMSVYQCPYCGTVNRLESGEPAYYLDISKEQHSMGLADPDVMCCMAIRQRALRRWQRPADESMDELMKNLNQLGDKING